MFLNYKLYILLDFYFNANYVNKYNYIIEKKTLYITISKYIILSLNVSFDRFICNQEK